MGASFRLDVDLNLIGACLGKPDLTTHCEANRWYLPREAALQHHRQRKGGLSLELGEGVSFEAAYTAGREAPTFKYSRRVSAGFGIKLQ